jgi:hypothetical protein
MASLQKTTNAHSDTFLAAGGFRRRNYMEYEVIDIFFSDEVSCLISSYERSLRDWDSRIKFSAPADFRRGINYSLKLPMLCVLSRAN